MKTKDEWISRTMESLDGMDSAACPKDLKAEILTGFPKRKRAVPVTSTTVLLKAAAVILLMIGLNLFTIIQFTKDAGNGNNAVRSAASEYFSYLNTVNL